MRQWIAFIVIFGLIFGVLFFSNIISPPTSLFGSGYGSGKRPNWPDDRFTIGPPSRYAKQGVYFDYAESHGVYIVTHHDMLVALSVNNPANDKPTRYNKTTRQFDDVYTGQRFTSNGLITGVRSDLRKKLDDPKAVRKALDEGQALPRSLERCYITLVGDPLDPDAELEVRPRHRFIHELNQWSRQYCAYQLPDQP